MTVKILVIRCFGVLAFWMHGFRGGLNLIGHRHPEHIALALRFLLNDQTLSYPAHLVERGTRLEAIVETKEREYCVRATPDEETGRLVLRAWDETGTDRTHEYLRESEHTPEQDFTDIFDKESACAHPRFLQYASEGDFFSKGNLSERTRGISRTGIFRTRLRAFLKTFPRERIRKGKEYELAQKNGAYTVCLRTEKKKGATLSASEEVIVHYLCFLHTASFWQELDLERNLHALKKPLIVTDLLEHLDEDIDTTDIFEKTRRLSRQSIILSTPALASDRRTSWDTFRT